MEAYVVHYTPLRERKASILQQFEREDLTVQFIESFDREALSEKDLEKFGLSPSFRTGTKSLILKTIETWRRISAGDKAFGLIFEDDAILAENFKDKLVSYLEELPADFDVLMINGGCNLHIPVSAQIPGKHIYFRGVHPTVWGGNGGTRCTDGYIISKACAQRFVNIFDALPPRSIHLPLDWWMNELMRMIDAKVYWAEPSIVLQGTETGLFKTSH